MRNMEERKAEIFRRSEKRIKTRRQKMRTLLCLPLLISVLFITMSLYSDRFTKTKNDRAEASVEGTVDSLESATVSVEVKSDDDETNVVLDDEATVVEILNVIHEVTNVNMETTVENSSVKKGYDDMSYTQQSSQRIYTIILTGEDGNTTTYLLCEEKMIDTKDNREYELSNEKLTTLKELLCISEE